MTRLEEVLQILSRIIHLTVLRAAVRFVMIDWLQPSEMIPSGFN